MIAHSTPNYFIHIWSFSVNLSVVTLDQALVLIIVVWEQGCPVSLSDSPQALFIIVLICQGEC